MGRLKIKIRVGACWGALNQFIPIRHVDEEILGATTSWTHHLYYRADGSFEAQEQVKTVLVVELHRERV